MYVYAGLFGTIYPSLHSFRTIELLSFMHNGRSFAFIIMNIYVTRHAKGDLMVIVKNINPGQPAQFAQADHGENFSLLVDFRGIK